MKRSLIQLLASALLAAGALSSCKVNDYCLNCETGDGGADGDGGVDPDAGDGGTIDPDAQDAGPCVPTGVEVCDGLDNDCNGQKDDNVQLTQDCPQMGECAGATKSCTNGEEVCSNAASPEVCDNKDNDCDGMVDDGDPGGGQRCGTDLGECVAGTLHCTNGILDCEGDVGMPNAVQETCNGKDDDCDGMFDEGLQNLGTCGPATDTGECEFGTLKCVGGGVSCVGGQGPSAELCDAIDQDCDGNNTNGFNLTSDPRNCGACGMVCDLPFAFEGCGGNPPACTVASCEPGHVNQNGVASDGCEYACNFNGAETCNGRDDDCDKIIDEDLVAPTNLCATQGECATGTTVTCSGTGGWKCNYTDPDVQTDANGNIVPETRCDTKDNDCDGTIDDNQPNLNQACDNGATGDCRNSGTFICNPANLNGPAVCNFTSTGPGTSPETCDGRDNNCDGIVDNGFNSSIPGQEYVTIPNSTVRIMKYEASRPNATATSGGSLQTHVCARPDVLPWTNVTYPQAVAACAASGARLCTEAEWQSMCSQPGGAPAFPIAGPTAADPTIVVEAEHATRVANAPFSWNVDQTGAYSGTSNMLAFDSSDSATSDDTISIGNSDVDSPRLDFTMSFAASGNYYVWARMYAGRTNDQFAYANISAVAGTQPPNNNSTLNANPTTASQGLWRWKVTGPFSVTAGTRTVSIFMADDGVRIDAIAVSTGATTPPNYDERIWAYGTDPKTPQPQTCNGDEFDTNTALAGDQDDVLTTGKLPQCFANGAGAADVFDMSGNVKEWALRRASNQNPLRGGSANNEVGGLTCQLNFTLADDTFFFPNVGFRCCK